MRLGATKAVHVPVAWRHACMRGGDGSGARLQVPCIRMHCVRSLDVQPSLLPGMDGNRPRSVIDDDATTTKHRHAPHYLPRQRCCSRTHQRTNDTAATKEDKTNKLENARPVHDRELRRSKTAQGACRFGFLEWSGSHYCQVNLGSGSVGHCHVVEQHSGGPGRHAVSYTHLTLPTIYSV